MRASFAPTRGRAPLSTCSQAYPIREGIPDFILEELFRSADPALRRMRFIDRMEGGILNRSGIVARKENRSL